MEKVSDNSAEACLAPWYNIPPRIFVAVEHPCIVKNPDKGIQTLGGFSEITQMMKDRGQPISLFLHPDDPASRPLMSTNLNTSNVLLKVIVPQRTGRKRKRGSDDPFTKDQDAPSPPTNARRLLRMLRDNADAAIVEPLGTISASQVFRTMPDFVYSTSDSHFMNQIREKILPFEYPLLKEWKLDTSQGQIKTEILPPPTLSTRQVPANYGYRQNPAVETFVDESTGQRHIHNVQRKDKIFTEQLQYDVTVIPNAPRPSAPPLSSRHPNFRSIVSVLTELFTRRPIWTRRALLNQFPSTTPLFLVKFGVAYVAYAFRSGAWRDTYIKLGVDPRSSPECRFYQTVMLQLVPRERSEKKRRKDFQRVWTANPDKATHIFTGKPPFPRDGKAWQLCDLEDPILAKIVNGASPRSTCDSAYFGWYPNGALCKIKTILKAKAEMLTNNEAPDDFVFQQFAALPDHIDTDKGDDPSYYLPANAHKRELEWAATYRAMSRTVYGMRPAPGRLSKSKPSVGRSFLSRSEGRSLSGLDNGTEASALGDDEEQTVRVDSENHIGSAPATRVELDDNDDEEGGGDLGLESDDNDESPSEMEFAETDVEMAG